MMTVPGSGTRPSLVTMPATEYSSLHWFIALNTILLTVTPDPKEP